jgi:FkbM family methyltransferase
MLTSVLQRIAEATSGLIGRDSFAIRTLRPLYEVLLDWITSSAGIPWNINGVEVVINPHFRNQMGHNYEFQVASFLRSTIESGDLCFDVGANIGAYVLQLAHWSAPDGYIFAFEPNSQAREILTSHVSMNHLQTRVSIEPFAIGDKEGEATLYSLATDGMSRLDRPNEHLPGRSEMSRVKVITLSAFARERNLEPEWLLIDVEGYEVAVLRGAADLINRRRSALRIIVELHPESWHTYGTSRSDFECLLRALHLRATPLTCQADPFDEHGVVLLMYT